MTQRGWKRLLLATLGGLVLVGAVGAGVVYWQYFRKDPQFVEEKRESEQMQAEIDGLFEEASGETSDHASID